jgi:hypothetical protein
MSQRKVGLLRTGTSSLGVGGQEPAHPCSGLLWEAEESEMVEGRELDGHHRATVERIFGHPVSHNIQWHDVLSLLESVAAVTGEHDGRYTVTLGSETQTFDAPRHHDIDEQQVIDLRRMLRGAGITPEST